MDKQEIIEGNKLIAEFMGWTIEPGMEEDKDPYYNWNKGFSMALLSDLLFHEKWDWLMPVVDKISSLCAYENGTGITVLSLHLLSNNQWRCHINYRKKYNGLNSEHKSIDIIKESLIKATWIAVTQFIQWFNSQKQ